jgi:hypothetical protein
MDELLVVISASISCKLSCVWWGLGPRVRIDGGLSGGGGSGCFVAGTATGTVIGTGDGAWSDMLGYTAVQEE